MRVAVQPSVGVQCDLRQESQPDVVDQEVQCDLGQESQPRVTSDYPSNRPWITGSEARRYPVHDYLNSETGDDTVASTLVVHGIPNAVPQREVIEYFQKWGHCILKTPEKDRKFWATYHGGKSWYGFVEFSNLTGADLLHVGLNLKHVIGSHELWVRPRPVNVLSIIVKSVPKAITKEHIIDHYKDKQIGRCWFQWNFSGLGNVWSAFLDRDMWTGFLQCESEDVLQDVLAAEREVRGVELKMERWSYQSHQLLLEEAKNKRNSERKTGAKGKRERDNGKGDGTGDRGKGGGKGGEGDGKGDSKGDGKGDSKGDSKGGDTGKGDGNGDGNGDEKGERVIVPNDGWANWQRDPSRWHFMTWTPQNIDPARRPLTGHGAARIELFLADDLTGMECAICILRGVLAQDGFASRCHNVEMLMKLFAYLLFDDATVPDDLTLRRRYLGDGVSVQNEAGWSLWQRDPSKWHRMTWTPQNGPDKRLSRAAELSRAAATQSLVGGGYRPGYGAARVELSLRDDPTEMTGGIKIHKGVMAQDCFANRCHNVEILMKWLASLLFDDTTVPDDLKSFLQQKGLSN